MTTKEQLTTIPMLEWAVGKMDDSLTIELNVASVRAFLAERAELVSALEVLSEAIDTYSAYRYKMDRRLITEDLAGAATDARAALARAKGE
jgi:hypothetical protein